MSDIFDEFKKLLKKDLATILVQSVKDPNNKITDNLNDIFNNSQTLLKDMFENFSKISFKNVCGLLSKSFKLSVIILLGSLKY